MFQYTAVYSCPWVFTAEFNVRLQFSGISQVKYWKFNYVHMGHMTNSTLFFWALLTRRINCGHQNICSQDD